MALLFSYAGADPSVWRKYFSKHLPGVEFRVFPDIGNPDDIEYAAVWMHPVGDLQNYPNLKAVLSFGAGVEHIIRDDRLPVSVPIVRLVDEQVAKDMAMHVLHWIIHFHRHYDLYLADQASATWSRYPHRAPHERSVGFLGMGAMGVIAAVVQYQDFFHVAMVMVVFVIGQSLEGYVLVPKLVGDSIGLHPVAVMFAILAGGELFGFVGVLVALPVAAVVMVVLRYLYGRYTESELYHGDPDAEQVLVVDDETPSRALGAVEPPIDRVIIVDSANTSDKPKTP